MKDELKELYGSNDRMEMSLSYSRVSDYDRNGPRALIQRTFVGGEGVKIGSITDDWLNVLNGALTEEKFNTQYLVYDGEKPTATLGKLVDIILKNYTKLPSKEKVLEIIKLNEFWKKFKDEKLDAAYNIPAFWDYLDAQFKSQELQLITTSEFELGKELATTLKTHPHSKFLFGNDCENLYQYKFNFEYNSFVFRGIMDIVRINHTDKTIRFIDLKTGQDSADNFINSFIKYRYYFQEALYTKAFEVVCKELGLKGYTLEPFQFLYIGRKEKLPILYNVSEKWHNAALTGFTTLAGYYYKGLDELLEEISWHLNNKIFDYTKEVYVNNGNVNLNDKFLIDK